MRRTAVIATALLFAPVAAHAAVREWHPARFDRIESAGSWDVNVVEGPVASVRAEGEADTLERMVVRVDGEGLHIGSKPGNWFGGGWHRGRVHVTVVAPAPLRAASVAGSGNMGIARLEVPRFSGSVAGSGNMTLPNVSARELELSIAGSGSLRAAGRAERVSANIAGSGDVRIGDLHTADLSGDIAGSGSLVAFATRTARLSIMGSGGAHVHGGARCTISRMGSGHADCAA